jgi:hypothetical protein
MQITSPVVKFFVCTVFVCTGTAKAQTGDRVVPFSSQITIDRDRTLHVGEEFEIVNNSGVFDSGIHRRLRIKPAGPQRATEGSIESISARLDGHDAVFHTARDGEVFDIHPSAEIGQI